MTEIMCGCSKCHKLVKSETTTFIGNTISHKLECGHKAETILSYNGHGLSDVLITTYNTD